VTPVRSFAVAVAACLAALIARPLVAAEGFDIGLAANGMRIDALAVPARSKSAPTVVLIGGLHGEDGSSAAVRAAVAAYERDRKKAVNLLAVPLANPDGAALMFPPSGVAYHEHAESQVLWRWLGSQAPDLVLIAGDDDANVDNSRAQTALLLPQPILADDVLCREAPDPRVEPAPIGKADDQRDFIGRRRIRWQCNRYAIIV